MGTWIQNELGNDMWSRALVALIDAGMKGIILLILAGLAVLVMRRASAAARHLIWTLALAGLLVLPVISLVVPKWQLPILPAKEVLIAQEMPLAQSPVPETINDTQPVAEVTSVSYEALPLTEPSISVPVSRGSGQPMAFWILLAWFAGITLVLTPLLAGFAVVARTRQKSSPFHNADLLMLVSGLAESLRLSRTVTIRCAGSKMMPMATGLVRPTIFLSNAVEEWPEEKRRVVLLHELAHVKRRDCLTHAVARLATSLHWFNPLVWVALRRLRIEREQACDDLVLATGERPSMYADYLLDIARTMRAGSLTSVAAITMAKKGQLEGRLHAVLDPRRNRRVVTRAMLVLSIILTGLIALPLAAVTLAQKKTPNSVSEVRCENNRATIKYESDEVHEIFVSVGNESYGWWGFRGALSGTATVEASDQIKMENGSLASGFMVRVKSAGFEGCAFASITPDGKIPFGDLVFRKNANITNTDGAFTFADIHQANGTLVPIFARVRPSTGKSHDAQAYNTETNDPHITLTSESTDVAQNNATVTDVGKNVSDNEANKTYLSRIERHEKLLEHCQVVYDTESYRYKSILDGKPERLPTPVGKGILTFNADGKKMRFDADLFLKDGAHEYLSELSDDGERHISWTRTATEPAGQITVRLLTEDSKAVFPLNELRPFNRLCSGKGTLISGLVFKQVGPHVVANWHDSPTHQYAMTFSEWHDVLRPETIRSIYFNAETGKEITASEVHYTYKTPAEGEDSEWPVKVETVLFEHDVSLILLVKKVDLSPSFTEATFRIDFPEGALVTDRIAGKVGRMSQGKLVDEQSPSTPPPVNTNDKTRTPEFVFKNLRDMDARYALALSVEGTCLNRREPNTPESTEYNVTFSFSQAGNRTAYRFAALEAPVVQEGNVSKLSPTVVDWIYVGPDKYAETKLGAITYLSNLDIEALMAASEKVVPIIYQRPPNPKQRTMDIEEIERALGRGYTRYATECIKVIPLPAGLLEVHLKTQELGGGRWELVVDPTLGYLVRKGKLLRELNGQTIVDMDIETEGFLKGDPDVSVANKARVKDRIFVGENTIQFTSAHLLTNEALFADTKKHTEPDAFPLLTTNQIDERNPDATTSHIIRSETNETNKGTSPTPNDSTKAAAPVSQPSEVGQFEVKVFDTKGKPAGLVSMALWRLITDPLQNNNTQRNRFAPFRCVETGTGHIWEYMGETQSDSKYIFDKLQSGTYRVSAQPVQEDNRNDSSSIGFSDPITLGAGQSLSKTTIHLLPGIKKALHFIDAVTKGPVKHVEYLLKNAEGFSVGSGSRYFNPYTNEDGVFPRILSPGKYTLTARTLPRRPDEPVYSLREDPMTFEVREDGQSIEIPMTSRSLTKEEVEQRWPFVVIGRVTDQKGSPVSGAGLSASCGFGTLSQTGNTTSGEDGSYTLRFAPGWRSSFDAEANDKETPCQAAIIHAFKAGYYEQNLYRQGGLSMAGKRPEKGTRLFGSDPDKVVLPNQPYRVDFVMMPGCTLHGTLLNSAGRPNADKKITMAGPELFPGTNVLCATKTDKEGRFEIGDIPAKKFWFEVDKVRCEPVEFASPGDYTLGLHLSRKPGGITLEVERFALNDKEPAQQK